MPIYTSNIYNLVSTATNFTLTLSGANFPTKLYVAVRDNAALQLVTVSGYNTFTGLWNNIIAASFAAGASLTAVQTIPPGVQKFKVEAAAGTLTANLIMTNPMV